jgi:hypothetical protein
MNVSRTLSLLSTAAALALSASAVNCARANTIFTLAPTNTSNGKVAATANFSFSGSKLTLVLTNTGGDVASPFTTKQGQDLSGLSFKTSGFTINALTQATATEGLRNSNFSGAIFDVGADVKSGDRADGKPYATVGDTTPAGRWFYNPTLPGLYALGKNNNIPATGTPSELITGNHPNTGSQSNFNPYIWHSATFVFNITASGPLHIGDANDQVTFLFGTGPDSANGSGGCTGGNCNTGGGIPEPASLSVLGLGAMGLLLRRRNSAKS